jgi:coenzyme PQQ synthesis protein D (PqqD)
MAILESALRLVPSASTVCAEVDGEAVLLNVDSGVYFGLDGVGTDIWRLLGRGLSEHEIVSELLDDYDVERHRLATDVAAFLDDLRRHSLVETAQK